MAQCRGAQRTLGDVSYSRSGGVGDCPRLIPTLGDPWETAGPRIDRIPLMRPPWWRRRYRELKIFFSPPSKCRIDIIGLLANRTMFKRECMLSILREGGLSSPTSAEPRRVTQAPRDRFGSACASSSLGPWSDDPSASVGGRDRTISAARIRSGSTPGSCTRASLIRQRSAI